MDVEERYRSLVAELESDGVRLVTDATVQHWHTESADGVTMHLSTGEVVVAEVGAVVGAHVGPGLLAVVVSPLQGEVRGQP